MKIFKKLKSLLSQNSHYFKVAFVAYPLSSVILIINALIFSAFVLNIISNDGDYTAYACVVTLLVMALESFGAWNLIARFTQNSTFSHDTKDSTRHITKDSAKDSTNDFAKDSIKNHADSIAKNLAAKNIINYTLNLALLAAFGTLISLFIVKPMIKEAVPFYSTSYFIGLYFSLCVAFFTLFVIGNLREREKSLLAFSTFAFITGIFTILISCLSGIFLLTIDYLFDVDTWRIWSASAIIFSHTGAIIFIGKMAKLNHSSIEREPLILGESKILSYFLNILNAFGYVYAMRQPFFIIP